MTIKLQLYIFKGRYQNELIVKVMFEREIYDYAFDVSKKKKSKTLYHKKKIFKNFPMLLVSANFD